MKILGIEAIFLRAKKLTSIKEPEHKIYPYLLKEYKNEQGQVAVDKPMKYGAAILHILE